MVEVSISDHRNYVIDSVCFENIKLILTNNLFSDSRKLEDIYTQIKVSKELKSEYQERIINVQLDNKIGSKEA